MHLNFSIWIFPLWLLWTLFSWMPLLVMIEENSEFFIVQYIGTAQFGTGQYLWQYGTGKFATGPPVILSLQLDGATTYFTVKIQRGQRLFWSTPIRGHGLYWDFSGLSHSKNTGPWQIYTTGPTTISDGDFNGAKENFWVSRYGAIRYFVW